MTKYGWRGKSEGKDGKDGVSLGLAVMPDDIDVAPPVIPTKQAEDATTPPLFRCTVEGCGKTFKARHVSAGHFRNKHPDLNKSKPSWKKYVEEV